jgi:hypothetical protein
MKKWILKIALEKIPATNQLLVNKKVVLEPEIRITRYIVTNMLKKRGNYILFVGGLE